MMWQSTWPTLPCKGGMKSLLLIHFILVLSQTSACDKKFFPFLGGKSKDDSQIDQLIWSPPPPPGYVFENSWLPANNQLVQLVYAPDPADSQSVIGNTKGVNLKVRCILFKDSARADIYDEEEMWLDSMHLAYVNKGGIDKTCDMDILIGYCSMSKTDKGYKGIFLGRHIEGSLDPRCREREYIITHGLTYGVVERSEPHQIQCPDDITEFIGNLEDLGNEIGVSHLARHGNFYVMDYFKDKRYYKKITFITYRLKTNYVLRCVTYGKSDEVAHIATIIFEGNDMVVERFRLTECNNQVISFMQPGNDRLQISFETKGHAKYKRYTEILSSNGPEKAMKVGVLNTDSPYY